MDTCSSYRTISWRSNWRDLRQGRPHAGLLAEKDIQAGILYQPWPPRLATGEHNRLCIKSARCGEPALKALADWLRAQVGAGNATPETVS